MRTFGSLVWALSLAAGGAAQLAPVGYVDVVLHNESGRGSPALATRVYYPAARSGPGTPRAPAPPAGWPAVVFLPGFAHGGSDYPTFASFVAGSGFAVLALETTRTNLDLLAADGAALLPAMRAAAARPGHPLAGLVDPSRAAVCGHSSGGGLAIRVLAEEPGYRTAIGFAAWEGPVVAGRTWPQIWGHRVRAPVLLIHGDGDPIAPWQQSAKVWFESLTAAGPLVVWLRMDVACDHANLISLLPSHLPSAEVFFESMTTAAGWLHAVLNESPPAIEHVVGATARQRKHTSRVHHVVRRPAVWHVGEPNLGRTVELDAAVHVGPAAWILGAAAPAALPTPWGALAVDPSSAVVDFELVGGGGLARPRPIAVPRDAGLVGVEVLVQVLGVDAAGGSRLSSPLRLVVRP